MIDFIICLIILLSISYPLTNLLINNSTHLRQKFTSFKNPIYLEEDGTPYDSLK